MSSSAYICPRCHDRLALPDATALPPACPACGLPITLHEFTQQRLGSSRVGRRGVTMVALSWLIGFSLLLILIGALIRFAKQ